MKKYLLLILGIIVAIAGTLLSLSLLIVDKLSGTEFVWLTLGTALIGIVITLLSEISEFSIGGNVVKLKEAKEDADKSIQAIKNTYKSIMKGQLLLTRRMRGGTVSALSTKDGRVDDFWAIYAGIFQLNLTKELAGELHDAALEIAKGQLSIIRNFSGDSTDSLFCVNQTNLPQKSQIVKHISDNKNNIEKMDLLLKAVDEYEKLLQLVVETKA
ncbi:TPA: hypothetical protein I7245_22375 [Vibrio vulnificus]|uniref:hypothetical protein n=1 Tax=Vibrio vulnificus TaxID=672 RepID=UPI001A1A16A3|nr:hypothetical protein [Vibrio vulnificus]WHE21919.1 hypothetical protein PVE41_01795 [Vibrio vulnificus]HAS6208499.1 hypothetical protein [Vibrio vulnificus]HAS6331945.1 hypothetical protein [Vibrio vulnificus]HAS6336724.1 hypothetical protein [Vibrio vulnificus]HAT8497784.1 hypothetical protein [Vibrio vulnificus]